MNKTEKSHFLNLIILIFIFIVFPTGCGGSKPVKSPADGISSPGIKPGDKSQTDNTQIPDVKENVDLSREIVEKTVEGGTTNNIKTSGFTKEEMDEIKKDGYLSYFYRRKYSKDEIKIVWEAVNKLFPQYSKEEKLLATRSVLAYHWVVYRTTPAHNLAANVAVTKKYRDFIEKYAKLHEVPVEMVEGIITWENSGGTSKKSWAACVGVGQLSTGAVNSAHEYYTSHLKNKEEMVELYDLMHSKFNFPLFHIAGKKHILQLDIFDVANRHREIRKKLKVDDERLIPDCNIEDAVVYLKILYNNYENRVDMAISTYHNGGLNNNDILTDYIQRVSNGKIKGKMNQKEIIAAMDQYKISFISLWRDHRSRDMLNGLRTVFGEITTSANQNYSLGDESDIYPWKVAAGYAALNAPDDVLKKLVDKYQGPWDVAECRGVRIYSGYDNIKAGIKSGWLVKLPSSLYIDKGIGGLQGGSQEYYKGRSMYNYYITPETLGFLYELNRVYRGRIKNNEAKIPLKGALESKILEKFSGGKVPEDYQTHLQGLALDVDVANAEHGDILLRVLREFFLHDHIYLVRKKGKNRICVNPRYGKYYYEKYLEWKNNNK